MNTPAKFAHVEYNEKTRKYHLFDKNGKQTSVVNGLEASKYLIECLQTFYSKGLQAISDITCEITHYTLKDVDINAIYQSYGKGAVHIAHELSDKELFPFIRALFDNLTSIPFYANTPPDDNKRFFANLLTDTLALILSLIVQSDRIELYKAASDFFAYASINLIAKHGYESSALFFDAFRTRLTQLKGDVKRGSFWNSALDNWNYEDTKDRQFVDRHSSYGIIHKARACTPTSCAAYFALLAKDMGDNTHDRYLEDYADYSAALHRTTKVFEKNYSVQYSKKQQSIMVPDDAEEMPLKEAKRILLELSKKSEFPAIKVAALEMVAQASNPFKAELLAFKENRVLNKYAHSAGRNVYDKALGTRGRGIITTLLILTGTALFEWFLLRGFVTYFVRNFHYSQAFRTDVIIISVIVSLIAIAAGGILYAVFHTDTPYERQVKAVRDGTISALCWTGHF